jgi:hypothetical protein
MLRALLAHLQEVLHKQQLVYFVCVLYQLLYTQCLLMMGISLLETRTGC